MGGNVHLLGQIIGRFVAAFFVSRLLCLFTRTWPGGVSRLIVVHAFSWLAISFIAGIGSANAGACANVKAVTIYAVPQAIWFVADVVWERIRLRRTVKALYRNSN